MLKNQRGQGLIEYLILIALVAGASVGIVRLMSQSVSAKFADVTNIIQGETGKKSVIEKVDPKYYKKRDMSDFMRGAVIKDAKE